MGTIELNPNRCWGPRQEPWGSSSSTPISPWPLGWLCNAKLYATLLPFTGCTLALEHWVSILQPKGYKGNASLSLHTQNRLTASLVWQRPTDEQGLRSHSHHHGFERHLGLQGWLRDQAVLEETSKESILQGRYKSKGSGEPARHHTTLAKLAKAN